MIVIDIHFLQHSDSGQSILLPENVWDSPSGHGCPFSRTVLWGLPLSLAEHSSKHTHAEDEDGAYLGGGQRQSRAGSAWRTPGMTLRLIDLR